MKNQHLLHLAWLFLSVVSHVAAQHPLQLPATNPLKLSRGNPFSKIVIASEKANKPNSSDSSSRETTLPESESQAQIQVDLSETTADWDVVASYYLEAVNLNKIGALNNAIESARQSLKLAEALDRSNYELTNQSYHLLIGLYRQSGANAEGVKLLKTALAYAQAHPQAKEVDICFYYLYMAQFQTLFNESLLAIEYLEKVVFLTQEKEELQKALAQSDLMAFVYSTLGVNYMNLKQLDKAAIYYKKALQLVGRQTGKEALGEIISNLTSIASVYSQKSNFDTAHYYFHQADSLLKLATANGQHGQTFFHQARKLLWHSAVNAMNGGNLDRAKAYFLELNERYPLAKNKWQDTGTFFYLAIIAEEQEDWTSALQYNHHALTISCYTFDDPDILQLPEVEDFRELGNTYWMLHQKARYLKLSVKHETDLIKKETYYKAALAATNLFDQLHNRGLRRMNLLRGGQHTSLFKTSLMNYKEGVSIAYQFDQQLNGKDAIEQGFYFTQKMKSQQLWMSLLRSEATALGGVPEALIQEEADLLKAILSSEQKLLEAKAANDSNQMKLYEFEHLFEKRNDYRKLLHKMERHYPAYYESKYAFVPENSTSLQSILNEKELLIEYVFTDEGLFAFTLSQQQPLRMHPLATDEQLLARIDSLQDMLQASSWMRKSKREKFITLSNTLYQQLLAPLADQLEGHERLIIIGDGSMNYIPFDVLLPSPEFKSFNQLDYLIRGYELSYHYSASLFARARRKKDNSQSGIFAFAPVYEQSGVFGETEQKKQAKHFAPLPDSEREVEAIVNLFATKTQDSSKQLLAVRKHADEAMLKAGLSMPYRYVHIAGHSFADLENPQFSGFACHQAPGVSASGEDGVLYAGEIYNLNTQADLVVLSSCESGFGKLESAEGLMGLNRAFVFSGTPNVVFSLWKVYDKISAKLMVDFYQEVLSGQDYSSSLRQAKLELLAKPETAAPHYWSPYLLIGC